MKKLFAVLFCTLVMAGAAFADELSYEIDPVATAKAPWKVGEKIIKEGNCCEGEKYYREFLGMTQSGLALVQDFYLSGEKFSDPFLIIVTNAENNMEDPFKNGVVGRYIFWYKNGQKQIEENYKNGKLEGVATIWYENGQKQGEGHYKNGQLEGLLTVWYENGQKEEESNWKESDFDGLLTTWYENGQKKAEINFKNGKSEGPVTSWHENGQKKLERNMKSGKDVGVLRRWDEKGNLIEEKDFGTP